MTFQDLPGMTGKEWKNFADNGDWICQKNRKNPRETCRQKEKRKREITIYGSKMNKEIRNYQESMFMGLNLRQCIFSLLAITVAVGIYFGLGKYVGQEMTGWMCILGAAPFAACGFFQYHGMNAEQFAWAYIKSEFLYPKRLLFQSEDLYHACMEETLTLGEKTKGNGTALLKKREQRARKTTDEAEKEVRKEWCV